MDEHLEDFPKELAEKIREGQEAGLTDDQIAEGIVQLGNVMAKFVRPDSPEEALISRIWKVSTDEEKRMLGNILVRMSKQELH